MKDKCPKCGEEFDTQKDEIIDCPCCGEKGSTACCNISGRNCPCVECEESEKEGEA